MKKNTGLIILGIVVVIVIALFATFKTNYNNFVELQEEVKEKESTIDVALERRADLIPNLVETIKGYTKHESNTLESVINLRSSSYDSVARNDKVELNNKLTTEINKIMVIIEKYPELKANDNFKYLTKQLTKNFVHLLINIPPSIKIYRDCSHISKLQYSLKTLPSIFYQLLHKLSTFHFIAYTAKLYGYVTLHNK